MKTATSDTLIDITVKPISRAPRRAASSGARPDSTCRVMFSIDDDRVVHDEPGRDRQRHQRQVVDAVAAAGTSRPNVPIRETGTATLGMSVERTFRRNDEDDEDDERDRDRERDLDVAHRRADRARRVDDDAESFMAAELGLELRQERRDVSTVSMMFAPGLAEDEQRTAGLPLESRRSGCPRRNPSPSRRRRGGTAAPFCSDDEAAGTRRRRAAGRSSRAPDAARAARAPLGTVRVGAASTARTSSSARPLRRGPSG
jgi:hypothetical protein